MLVIKVVNLSFCSSCVCFPTNILLCVCGRMHWAFPKTWFSFESNRIANAFAIIYGCTHSTKQGSGFYTRSKGTFIVICTQTLHTAADRVTHVLTLGTLSLSQNKLSIKSIANGNLSQHGNSNRGPIHRKSDYPSLTCF